MLHFYHSLGGQLGLSELHIQFIFAIRIKISNMVPGEIPDDFQYESSSSVCRYEVYHLPADTTAGIHHLGFWLVPCACVFLRSYGKTDASISQWCCQIQE